MGQNCSIECQPKVNLQVRGITRHIAHLHFRLACQLTSRVCSLFGVQKCKGVVLVEGIDWPLQIPHVLDTNHLTFILLPFHLSQQ